MRFSIFSVPLLLIIMTRAQQIVLPYEHPVNKRIKEYKILILVATTL